MKVFFISFGWTNNHVMGCFTRHGLGPRDQVFLVTPEILDGRSLEAIETTRKFIEGLGIPINMRVLKVPFDFKEAVNRIYEKIMEFNVEGNKIIINLSGGMRFVVLATYTAFLMVENKKNIILDELTLEGKNQTVTLWIPPLTRYKSKDIEQEIMEAASKRELSLDEIAQITGVLKTNVWKYVDNLCKLGLLLVRKVNNKNFYVARGWI